MAPYKVAVFPLVKNKPDIVAKAKEIFPEGWLLISIPWDKLVTIIESLKEMKWVPPSYSEGREKFCQREARLIEECFRSAENL